MGQYLSAGHYGASEVQPGDRIDCGTKTVSADLIDAFAELTGDRFEIHMSRDAARRHGFETRVAHGLLVLSLIDGMKNQATAQIRARASLGWDWRFSRPVLAGDRIGVVVEISGVSDARAEDQAVLDLDFTVSNQEGALVQTGRNRLLAYRWTRSPIGSG